MKWSRPVAVVLLLLALGVAVTKTSSSSTAFPFSAPCDASALAASFSGSLKVQSVDSFGCVGSWGYVWATIGTGVHQMGVTEIAHYDTTAGTWRIASRLKYCGHHLLPTYVDFWGCNSN
jgi:hypothetical protein